MTLRLFATLALLTACSSAATQTRATPTGGVYALFPSSREGVADSARQALAGISKGCKGNYEIVALDAVPDAEPGEAAVDRFYLDRTGHPATGPFRTLITYECRTPNDTTLNQRLELAASKAKPAAVAPSAVPDDILSSCKSSQDCTPGLLCYEGHCRS